MGCDQGMKCSKCGEEIRTGRKFCGKCGTAIKLPLVNILLPIIIQIVIFILCIIFKNDINTFIINEPEKARHILNASAITWIAYPILLIVLFKTKVLTETMIYDTGVQRIIFNLTFAIYIAVIAYMYVYFKITGAI